ncbi:hypothetical protein C2G38_2196816 [Gigaspora rosea]|uniref:Uncharacterized protein n=1 Tax=Gigaspora rosea TaxID=44941 RepID=A0A397UUB6_9GLOM|nr:hypothetical protein C2G38_2196816 [Gigaspora rosea]
METKKLNFIMSCLTRQKLITTNQLPNNTYHSATNTYTLKDLEYLLEIKQDTATKFQVNFNFIMGRYKESIVDLTKLVGIEPSNDIDDELKEAWIEVFKGFVLFR